MWAICEFGFADLGGRYSLLRGENVQNGRGATMEGFQSHPVTSPCALQRLHLGGVPVVRFLDRGQGIFDIAERGNAALR